MDTSIQNLHAVAHDTQACPTCNPVLAIERAAEGEFWSEWQSEPDEWNGHIITMGESDEGG